MMENRKTLRHTFERGIMERKHEVLQLVESLRVMVRMDRVHSFELTDPRRIRDAESTEFELMLQITEKIIGPEYRQKVAFARIHLR